MYGFACDFPTCTEQYAHKDCNPSKRMIHPNSLELAKMMAKYANMASTTNSVNNIAYDAYRIACNTDTYSALARCPLDFFTTRNNA